MPTEKQVSFDETFSRDVAYFFLFQRCTKKPIHLEKNKQEY